MEIAKLILQLGVAGAALFLLYHFVNRLFDYLKERNKSEGKKDGNVERLCEKIDRLVETFYTMTQKISDVLQNSTRDQADIISRLDKHTDILMDIQKRVVRVDDRTYQCLGNTKKEV